MLEHWLSEIPSDPIKDIDQLDIFPFEKKCQYVNGITEGNHLPMEFTPLQLCITWFSKSEEQVDETIRKLILSGADVNRLSTRGHNSLHLFILSLFYSKDQEITLQRLEHFISKGVDVNLPCLLQTRKKELAILQPLDLLVGILNHEFELDKEYHFPRHLETAPFQTLSQDSLRKVLILFYFYGGTVQYPEHKIHIDRILSLLTWKDVSSIYPELWRDYMTVRYKLPLGLGTQEIEKRIRFLYQHKDQINHDWIVKEREHLWYTVPNNVYLNPLLETPGEFVPYEFVQYTETDGHSFWFHKTLLPHMFQNHLNPLTRSCIASSILERWFYEWNLSPVGFHQLFLLRETLSQFYADYLTIHQNQEDQELIRLKSTFLFRHIHSLLSYHFPYSNLIKVRDQSLPELRFIMYTLSSEPYEFMEYKSLLFQTEKSFDETLYEFAQITLNSMINKTDSFSIQSFFFGIENALQDLSCYHLICLAVGKRPLSRENFLDMILHHPEAGDVIRDRVGYVHLGYFFEIWQRLVIFQNDFL